MNQEPNIDVIVDTTISKVCKMLGGNLQPNQKLGIKNAVKAEIAKNQETEPDADKPQSIKDWSDGKYDYTEGHD